MSRLPIFLLSAFSLGCVSVRECKRYGELQHSLGQLRHSLEDLDASIKAKKPENGFQYSGSKNGFSPAAGIPVPIKQPSLEMPNADPCKDMSYEQCRDYMRGLILP